MNASFDLAVDDPEQVHQAVSPSLRDSSAVAFTTDADDTLTIDIKTGRLGPMRGATNTALMLTKLATKILED